jgi:activator of HSP90 ATPase
MHIMPKTILQTIIFKRTTAKELYELYMDSKKHTIATGSPAELSPREGGSYSAHDGYITGKNLQLQKDRLIVQSWRASTWDNEDVDSTFIICLMTKENDVVLHAVHANVPDKDYESLKKGWHQHYWEPWKKYLKGKPITKSAEM